MMLHVWILTFLIGFTSLQAIETSIDSLEGDCRPLFIIDTPARTAPIFAFVYSDNAKTTRVAGVFGESDGYKSKKTVVFNTRGPIAKIVYDDTTGELTVPTAGRYEVVYCIQRDSNFTFMALAVNGEQITESVVPAKSYYQSATFILTLAKGDRISLVLSSLEKTYFIARNGGVGNSTSLFVKKI
jgi:hypothetical protein